MIPRWMKISTLGNARRAAPTVAYKKGFGNPMVQEVLNTKIKVYRATVLTTLLYGAETWTCYRRHVKMLDAFHMRHLRYLMGIKW